MMERPALEPGGRMTLENPSGTSLTIVRSSDGSSVGFAPPGSEPLMLPLCFLKSLLQMCGYIVMERESLPHHEEERP